MELQLDFEDVRFTKVKYKHGESVEIAFEHGSDQYAVKLTEGPHPEFVGALLDLGPHGLALCSVPEDAAYRVEVRGVVIKHSSEGDRSVVVTLLRATRAGKVLVLNTPLSSWVELSKEMRKGIEEVCWQAWLYLNGRRAQQELEFGIEGAESVEAGRVTVEVRE